MYAFAAALPLTRRFRVFDPEERFLEDDARLLRFLPAAAFEDFDRLRDTLRRTAPIPDPMIARTAGVCWDHPCCPI